MSIIKTNDQYYKDIAFAIADKKRNNIELLPSEMANEINSILTFEEGPNGDYLEYTAFPLKATGEPIDKQIMANRLKMSSEGIIFSTNIFSDPKVGDLNNFGNIVYYQKKGDFIIYSIDGGGVAAPIDSSYLFSSPNNFLRPGERPNPNDYWQTYLIDLSGLDTRNVENMEGMFNLFYDSYGKTLIGLEKIKTNNVTNMKRLFSYAKILDLNLSTFKTNKVINMESMFECYSANSPIVFSSFNTSNVTNMRRMFYKSNMDKLDLSSFTTEKLENVSEMFAECTNLIFLDLSNFNTSNIKDLTGMFVHCDKLATVICRSQEDINKLKSPNTYYSPNTNFILKEGV